VKKNVGKQNDLLHSQDDNLTASLKMLLSQTWSEKQISTKSLSTTIAKRFSTKPYIQAPSHSDPLGSWFKFGTATFHLDFEASSLPFRRKPLDDVVVES
jgi:hypothetical protein